MASHLWCESINGTSTRSTATNVHCVLQRTITMRIEIATRDGLAPSYVFRPEGPGKGPWPAVLVFMDGIGIRPAMLVAVGTSSTLREVLGD